MFAAKGSVTAGNSSQTSDGAGCLIIASEKAVKQFNLKPLARFVSFAKLQYRITIDDPKIFTRPFSQDFELTLRADWDSLGLLEYMCEENNRCAGGNCRPSGTP